MSTESQLAPKPKKTSPIDDAAPFGSAGESSPQARREFLAAQPPPGEPTGFIDTDELLRRLPVSRGTIQNWCRSGKLPFIKTPGRRVLFCWENVANALRRMERGGQP